MREEKDSCVRRGKASIGYFAVFKFVLYYRVKTKEKGKG